MAFDEGDKALCMQIAREIVTEVLNVHVKTCPVSQSLKVRKAMLIGICVGVGIGSGIGSTGIAMLLLKAFGS